MKIQLASYYGKFGKKDIIRAGNGLNPQRVRPTQKKGFIMEANATTLKVKVYVEEKKTHDGREFKTYKAVTSKNGVKVNLKFTKDVKNLPEKSCFMFVDIDHINEQKNAEYATVWVNEVLGYEDFNAGGDTEANRARMREMFGN